MADFSDGFDPQDPQVRLRALLEASAHFVQSERYDLAEKKLLEGLATFPNEALIHYQLGFTYLLWDRDQDAEKHTRESLRLDPEDADTYELLGRIQHKRGKNQEAEQLFLDALKIEPTSASALFQYGALMHTTGHTPKAEQLVRLGLSHDPENEYGHSLLASVLDEQKGGRGREAGLRALNLAPDEDTPHYSLGMSYLRSGRPFRARKHLREALRIDPSDEDNEEAYLQADFFCRWTALPYYYWSLALERVPGAQFGVWGAFVLAITVLPSMGVPREALGILALCYLALAIYTWLASPITKVWIRLRPPR